MTNKTEAWEAIYSTTDDFLMLLKDDAYAISFQSMGQYRTALIEAYRQHQSSADGWLKLYKALHAVLAPAYDYVQKHQSEFNVGPGGDMTPAIVEAFLESRSKPSVKAEVVAWRVGGCVFYEKENAENYSKYWDVPVYALGVITDQPVTAAMPLRELINAYGRACRRDGNPAWKSEEGKALAAALAQRSAPVAAVTISDDEISQQVKALFQPWPDDEMGPSDEPESQYQHGYNTALEDALEILTQRAGTGGDAKDFARLGGETK